MPRDPLLAQIHIGRAALKLHEDDYRAMLARITGQSSAAGLNDTQRRAVIAELRRLGWKDAKASPARHRPASGKKHIRLIFALWGELKRAGIWRNPERASLRAFVKRMSGVDDPEFLDPPQAMRVIEALKAMKEKGHAET